MATAAPEPRDGLLQRVARRRIVLELAIVGGLLVLLRLYGIALGTLDRTLQDRLLATSLERPHTVLTAIDAVLFLGGVLVLVFAYASVRDVAVPTSLPERSDARLVGVAALAGAVLAVVPNVVGAAFIGVPTDHLATAVLEVDHVVFDRMGIWIAWFVAGMALVYHGLVQESFRRVLDGDRAVALTTLLGAYVAIPKFPGSSTLFLFANGPWLNLYPERGLLAVLILVGLGVAVYADEHVADARVRRLALVPVVVASGVAVLSIATSFEGPLELLPVLGKVGVVGAAAYAYEGTDSLVAPAATYGAFALVVSVLSRGYMLAFFGG